MDCNVIQTPSVVFILRSLHWLTVKNITSKVAFRDFDDQDFDSCNSQFIPKTCLDFSLLLNNTRSGKNCQM